jgi:hypothetical protein
VDIAPVTLPGVSRKSPDADAAGLGALEASAALSVAGTLGTPTAEAVAMASGNVSLGCVGAAQLATATASRLAEARPRKAFKGG